MLRVIIDTSVAAAGSILRARFDQFGAAADIVYRWSQGRIRGLMSKPLLAEYVDVLNRPKLNIPDERRDRTLAVAQDAQRTEQHELGPPPFERVSKDETDDHLLALVRAGDPDYLCSGDVEGLLELHIYRDTIIVDASVLHYAITLHELQEGALAADAKRARETLREALSIDD